MFFLFLPENRLRKKNKTKWKTISMFLEFEYKIIGQLWCVKEKGKKNIAENFNRNGRGHYSVVDVKENFVYNSACWCW